MRVLLLERDISGQTTPAAFAAELAGIDRGRRLVCGWRAAASGAVSKLVSMAAHADIVVVGAPDLNGLPDKRMKALRAVLHGAGRPVLIVPDTAAAWERNGEALVLWDGSADAQVALEAALPLLSHFDKVTLFYADDGSIRLPIDQAKAFLSRAGIAATIVGEIVLLARASTIILAEVERRGPALVVLGAYGHRRLIESVFGGVTDTMLRCCPAPMLMARRP